MNPYFVFVVLLLVFSVCWQAFVDWLNYRHALSNQLPAEFVGICDEAKYLSSQSYLAETTKYELFKSLVGLPVTLAFLCFGGFGFLDHFARSFGSGEIATGLYFFAALGIFTQLYALPFSLYETFVIEEKFGFNKSTLKIFFIDLLKGSALAIVLGGPILAGVLWFFLHFGSHAWLYAWIFFTVIQVVLLVLAPTLIMPLFNKFSPLEVGELRTAIERYAAEQKFALAGIFTMDGSKRSSKANAFFTGFGRLRRIVLFDTLIEKQKTPELVAVLAHEIGHYKERHVLKFLFLSVGMSFVLFYFFSLFLGKDELLQAFHFEQNSIYASLLCISFLYTPLASIFGLIKNIISRHFEFEADAYAARTTQDPRSLASALTKLSIDNLSNLNPHHLKVFLEYSHPPVVARIRALVGEPGL